MNYKNIYDCLIGRAKHVKSFVGYYEKHHIIPRCVGGDDSSTNIVKLTPKQHYVAHHLLVKIYQNTKYISKLVCAFRYMSVDSHNGNRIGLRDYSYMRDMFKKYHPMKNIESSSKTSIGVKKYWSLLSEEKKESIRKQRSENLKKYWQKITEQERYDYIKKMKDILNSPIVKEKLKKSLHDYYKNETVELKNKRKEKQKISHTIDSYRKTSKSLKEFIDKMTDEELDNRLNNSLRKCDHKKRGELISKAKKGKKNKSTGDSR